MPVEDQLAIARHPMRVGRGTEIQLRENGGDSERTASRARHHAEDKWCPLRVSGKKHKYFTNLCVFRRDVDYIDIGEPYVEGDEGIAVASSIEKATESEPLKV